MSTNDLFSIIQVTKEEGIILVQLGINAGSEIFEGHFPGHPVVPGASMLQMVKDVLEEVLDVQLRLKKAGHLKFMSLIEPGAVDVQLEIDYKLKEDNEFLITSKLSAGETICFKFHGVFTKSS